MHNLSKTKHKEIKHKWKIHMKLIRKKKKRILINAVLKKNIKQILIAILKSTSNI